MVEAHELSEIAGVAQVEPALAVPVQQLHASVIESALDEEELARMHAAGPVDGAWSENGDRHPALRIQQDVFQGDFSSRIGRRPGRGPPLVLGDGNRKSREVIVARRLMEGADLVVSCDGSAQELEP